MLLAEALAQRAEAQHRLDELRSRLIDQARVQEGDEPAEDPAELLKEAAHVLEQIEVLVRRINHTNSVTPFEGDATLTDAIARRDALVRAGRRRGWTATRVPRCATLPPWMRPRCARWRTPPPRSTASWTRRSSS